MSKPIVTIKATGPGGQTMQEFSKLIAKRMKYMNEAANGATLAMGLNFWRSVRSATKVAKVGKLDDIPTPKVSEMTFIRPGYYTLGQGRTASRHMCIRRANGGERVGAPHKVLNAKVVYGMPGVYTMHGIDRDLLRASGCFGFQYRGGQNEQTKRNYIIAAPSKAIAEKAAKMILLRMKMKYAGLAKRAVTALMCKVWKNEHQYAVPIFVAAVAEENISYKSWILRSNTDGGGVYAITMRDELDYAVSAVRGGRAGVDLAMKKACNKAAGLIKRRCADLLLPGEIKTPFPEIRRRKAA